jgi:hypothetical protein
MVERADRARFAFETGPGARVAGERRRQPLDRDRAIEPRIAGAIHLAHAARAERADELIEAEARTWRGCGQPGRLERSRGSADYACYGSSWVASVQLPTYLITGVTLPLRGERRGDDTRRRRFFCESWCSCLFVLGTTGPLIRTYRRSVVSSFLREAERHRPTR